MVNESEASAAGPEEVAKPEEAAQESPQKKEKRLRLRRESLAERAKKLARRYRVKDGKGFRLSDVDPGDTAWLEAEDKPAAREALQLGIEALAELQDMLYAQDRWAVLLIFQAMDAAGKDGAIKHVLSGVNPQGCQVSSFKAPSSEDLDHDYLWRCSKNLPERGRIGIFNRSYYEEVLVVRVHQELLEKAKIPRKLISKNIWEDRFRDIRAYERYLNDNGVLVRKFFLHLSRGEQKKRFLDRIERPEKNWKFSANDAKERGFWDDYQKAFSEVLSNTSTKWAPWHVIPADDKPFARIAAAAVLADALIAIDPNYPTVSREAHDALEAAKVDLEAQAPAGAAPDPMST
ncbi:MAG TPA: PPK2 family polyphosphate kinase, partial [Thermoanaerobaculia bacterium]|nr:PPK2 family polyphosphate kinase [Thermoanaerobaculia bacterium]